MIRTSFSNLVDVSQVQQLMDNEFLVTGMPCGLVDMRKKTLVASGWQSVCPGETGSAACEACTRKDALARVTVRGEEPCVMQCPNGWWDIAIPIRVSGRQEAVLFLGPFCYEGEKDDSDSPWPVRPAAITAPAGGGSGRVPIFARERVWNLLEFYRTLVQMLAEIGLKNLLLQQEALERMRAQEALQDSQNRLQLAMDSVNEGLWDCSIATGSLYCSPRYYEVLGLRPDSSLGTYQSWRKLVHPDDLPMVERGIGEYLKSGQDSFAFELRLKTKAGDWKWMLARGRAVEWDAGGRPMRLIGTHVDISEQKRVEESKSQLEGQLRQSQKMEAIGTLAGGVAHDFNNVLGAIIGFAELAKMDAAGQTAVEESLAELLKACGRGRDLVQQILAFSRRQSPERRPVQLAAIVKETLALLRSTLPGTVKVEADLPAALPLVSSEPTQIQQVLMNLITNAAHAMRGREGRLQVKLERLVLDPESAPLEKQLGPGTYVRLTVTDNGHGMDAGTLQRIFEPFFTTKPVGEGTGLGLPVVQGIVEAHRGSIQVRSEVGVGTTFEVLLPALAAETAPNPPEPEPAPRGCGERVMFVDDEATMCGIARRMLHQLGYEVTTFTNPALAWERFAKDPEAFDLVLTDLSMPGLTGVDLGVKMLQLRPALPVILISGFAGKWSREMVLSTGIRDIIAKPVTPDSFLRVISSALHPEATALPDGGALPVARETARAGIGA